MRHFWVVFKHCDYGRSGIRMNQFLTHLKFHAKNVLKWDFSNTVIRDPDEQFCCIFKLQWISQFISNAQNVTVSLSRVFFSSLKEHKVMIQFDQQKKSIKITTIFPSLVTKNPRKGNKGENAKKKFTDNEATAKNWILMKMFPCLRSPQ